ncbi:hypothetical protein C1J03_18225 [Sulfitobacter sp. SK012]|uniref:hypothetical protein n=1 Tax=Sulfitobacter sp. SK012 TaxID=1389005 RepID=UPI000E0B218B|nr:hypothetical protein [Sulfitobacter sp. SK012]AXI47772.1 hypothetical protein C1J03_18225 [Sulfitobacter sp. SK012]
MRAVFHIGRPKVGSTSIQSFLYANTNALSRMGVLYDRLDPNYSSQWELPIAALSASGIHIPDPHISRLLQIEKLTEQERYAEQMVRRFEASLAKNKADKDLYVASSEHAAHYLRTPSDVTRFDKLLRQYFDAPDYVVYIRDQVSLTLSAYSEMIKRGGTTAFPEYLNKSLRQKRFDHARVLAPWIEAVGPERLKVRLLERDGLVGGDLIDDFCDSAGIDPTGLERPTNENPSLSRDAAEVMRVLNGYLPSLLENGRRNPLARGLLDRLMTHYANEPPLQMSVGRRTRTQTVYAEGNESVRAMFFAERTSLFTPKKDSLTNPQVTNFDPEATLQIALSMLIATRQGKIAPLSARELRRAISLDPLTATPSGTSPQRATLYDRWPVLRSPRFQQLNPFKRG